MSHKTCHKIIAVLSIVAAFVPYVVIYNNQPSNFMYDIPQPTLSSDYCDQVMIKLNKRNQYNEKQHPSCRDVMQNILLSTQSNSPPEKGQTTQKNTMTIIQHLVDLTKLNNDTIFKCYIETLSSSQINDVVRYMGVSNLTGIAQKQFLKCSGRALLEGKQPNSPIHLLPSFQHCKNMSFKSSGPKVMLVSFPGSGNSWVRQLLETATGIYTGAQFCDQTYPCRAGMIGEGVETENVLVIKAHNLPNKSKDHHAKVIYIVRSPFGAILAEHKRGRAYFSYKYGDEHTAEVNDSYDNPNWDNEVEKQYGVWALHVRKWLNQRHHPIHFVGYENLQKDIETELKKMLDFIGYPYSEDDVLCAVKSKYSETFHRKYTKDIHAYYSPAMQIFVNNQTKLLNTTLLKQYNISLL